MKAQESWALDLYIATALRLQSIERCDVPPDTLENLEVGESAEDVLPEAYQRRASAPILSAGSARADSANGWGG